MPRRLVLRLPFLQWARQYNAQTLSSDVLAALIVTLMLIPQSLAYATLAGMPAQAGLYASIVPLVLYAALGSSRVLAVGPVAVISLMTAAALAPHAAVGSEAYMTAAITLATLSGLILWVMGVLRLGFLAQFLSHPVISGFMTASALLIAAGQIKVVLGLSVNASTFLDLVLGMLAKWDQVHLPTAIVGLSSLLALWVSRRYAKPTLTRLGLSQRSADLASKAAPVVVIAVAGALTWAVNGTSLGIRTVGHVPSGLPPLTLPSPDPALWQALLLPALLISVVGFVESVSVGQTLAARRRERIEPNQELVALGASNLGAAFTGGFPVTGGFSRSVVNFDAGAQTPAAGLFTAAGIVAAAVLLTPALEHIAQATLAATIIVAVMSLADWGVLVRTWRYAKSDFLAVAITLGATLDFGVELGLIAGVSTSLALFLFRTAHPHIAEVGWVPGTEHFRNVQRHAVTTSPMVLSLRVDESLYFANARALEDRINEEVAGRPALRHVVLLCSAINDIDASALESLEAIEQRLSEAGIALHLSEVKGPVMDRLGRSDFINRLDGRIFLTHYQAITALDPQLRQRAAF